MQARQVLYYWVTSPCTLDICFKSTDGIIWYISRITMTFVGRKDCREVKVGEGSPIRRLPRSSLWLCQNGCGRVGEKWSQNKSFSLSRMMYFSKLTYVHFNTYVYWVTNSSSMEMWVEFTHLVNTSWWVRVSTDPVNNNTVMKKIKWFPPLGNLYFSRRK